MLKGIGLLLIVLCGGLAGVYAASGLKRQHQRLVHLSALLHELEVGMWCHGGTLQELLTLLLERDIYRSFAFLEKTRNAMEHNMVFSEAWTAAVQEEVGLQLETKALLCELGQELGVSDLFCQRETLERYRSRLQQQETASQEACRKKTRLYQSIGLLAGMAAAILLC